MLALNKVISPPKADNEAKLPTQLTAWMQSLAEFEARFEPIGERFKQHALSQMIPTSMWENRFLGREFKSFRELYDAVRAITADRTQRA